jgi:hypothetical protein
MDEQGRFEGREYGAIRVPEVETQMRIGNTTIYVFDVEEPTTYEDRWTITGHDDNGNEVEIKFHPTEDANEYF